MYDKSLDSSGEFLNKHADEVVRMHHQEGMSPPKIGAALGTTGVTVKKWLQKRGIYIERKNMPGVLNSLRKHSKDIITRYQNGETTKSIGKSYRASDGSVLLILKENNIEIKNSKPNMGKIKAQKDKIIKLYMEGETLHRMQKIFNCDHEALRYNLNKWRINTSGENQIKKPSTKWTINKHFWDSPESEEVCYFLGWMASDGCVRDEYNFLLGVKKSDNDIIYKFAKILNYNGPLRNRKRDGNREDFSLLQISNKYMVNKLEQYGIVKNKTFILKYPDIPKEYQHAFCRGYLEGDGWIAKSGRIGICCVVQEMLERIKETLPENIKSYTYIREKKVQSNRKPIYQLEIYKKNIAKEFLQWIYQDTPLDSDLCLRRKRQLAYDLYGV